MWKSIVVFVLLASLSCEAQVVDLAKGEWHDLTHEYSEQTLYWPTARRFEKDTVFEGVTDSGFYYTAYDIETAEHGGTHMDAPIHFYAGGQTAEQVPLGRLIGPAALIDVTLKAASNADYLVSTEDVLGFETLHGQIEEGTIVLIRTGYGKHWPDPVRYLGTATRGPEAISELHFPGIAPEAAELLVQRGIAAVGLDTASVDFGQSTEFMTHQVLFAANIPGFENVANLEGVPPRGALVVALPMKIKGGSGAPLRIVAFVPGG